MYTSFKYLLVLAAALCLAEGCGPKNIECLNNKTYKFCFLIGTTTVYVNSIELSCGVGTICNENDGVYACIAGDEPTTTTTTTTTTPAITTASTTTLGVAPDCSVTGAGKFIAQSCNQYYECSPFLWWFNLNLQTCAAGQAFDAISQTCAVSTTCIVK